MGESGCKISQGTSTIRIHSLCSSRSAFSDSRDLKNAFLIQPMASRALINSSTLYGDLCPTYLPHLSPIAPPGTNTHFALLIAQGRHALGPEPEPELEAEARQLSHVAVRKPSEVILYS